MSGQYPRPAPGLTVGNESGTVRDRGDCSPFPLIRPCTRLVCSEHPGRCTMGGMLDRNASRAGGELVRRQRSSVFGWLSIAAAGVTGCFSDPPEVVDTGSTSVATQGDDPSSSSTTASGTGGESDTGESDAMTIPCEDASDGELGAPCGPCDLDRLVCDASDRVVCDGDTPCRWVEVAAGEQHTCGLRSDGTLWCWGRGVHGQRGDGTTDEVRTTPTRVLAADEPPGGSVWNDWVAVAVGGGSDGGGEIDAAHTCGMRADHSLWCWGHGGLGQRGDGTIEEIRTTPVRVTAGLGEVDPWGDWIAVTAGHYHTCGLRTDRSAWCWGRGAHGRLGHGSEADAVTPVRVVAEGDPDEIWTDWTALAAGRFHTCGRRENRTLWCWGQGTFGQRGDGTTHGTRVTPVRVLQAEEEGAGAWSNWAEVVVGDRHSCGRRENGTVWCWGHGVSGQRGDGTLDPERTTPTQVLASDEDPGGATWDDWASLAAGRFHLCGRRLDGTLWCWGPAGHGRLGHGGLGDARTTPIQVVAADQAPGGTTWADWTRAAGGSRHTCGLRADDTLWCWGWGEAGQRGDGTTDQDRVTPIGVIDVP
jgi:alpha-tubulin suppressor-like RCC1 family protein